ncbi:hypothetical protein [Halocatena halophila]|uniref:hypothetical protein n=1 Tax=Halocatena halophila TaxID=2814576 RepID=UPI002ED42FC5
MKYKVVPPIRDRSFIETATTSLPVVPASEADCCGRLQADTSIESRDVARQWITFLQALGFVTEADGKYYQGRSPPTDLGTAFLEGVYGAQTVVETVADSDTPLRVGEVYEAVKAIVPQYERSRRTDWEAVWETRIARLLAWAVEFELLVSSDAGYSSP